MKLVQAYDTRHVTLDPGLTLLALQGLRRPRGDLPFLGRYLAGRRVLPPAAGDGRLTPPWLAAAWGFLKRGLA
ncbi:MAG: hypothetical protein HY002_00620 [Candidatus Rokubacteria bacterium]|nr:hypothetical protein [Candidatus Rokubacteria bacterium]